MIKFKDINNLKSPSRQEMENAFNNIYEEYSYFVFYVAFSLLKNRSDAEDITNETFLKMYEKRYNISSEKNLKYYLVVTAKNLSYNLLDYKNKYVILDEEIKHFDEKSGFDECIEKFKSFLNEEEIGLIVYKYLYDFTFKEIAMIEGKSIFSISSKYRRAISKLKKHYKGGML